MSSRPGVRAGSSRATLYNHFPTRENLLQAYMRRETQHIHRTVHGHVRTLTDRADALIAGMCRLLDQVRSHPAQAEWFAATEWINRIAVSFLSFSAPAPRTDAEEGPALRWYLLRHH
ncbi:TetR/AcrR family transcriptional regulator [Streptomyces sp. NPDC014724]|uniref:TetR/AcrR family transcriptional regulator n=1 Tax=unclassified Streptomyces TaxID=2593676 RepID=UPI0036F7CB9E